MVLAPYAGEPEVGDPAMSGGFAAELAQVAMQGDPPWCTYVARIDDRPAGSGGFNGAPDEDGAVEIGYLTFIPARRGGVATALAAALVGIARDGGAQTVIAHTLPDQNASTPVLARNGFSKVAEVVDPEDGPVWRWARSLP